MKLTSAGDSFITDMQRMGRLRGPNSEDSYRRKLRYLAEDVGNRDPSKVGRNDIKRYLSRWPNPNSQAQAHGVAVSFFDWCQEEGFCKYNPARQVRRAKRTKPDTYRMTRGEVRRFLKAASEPNRTRDKWVAYLLCCAGLRSAELRSLKGRHFHREGWVWVEHGKGDKQRWVPVLDDLEPVVAEILTTVGPDDFVFPGRRVANPPWNTEIVVDSSKPIAASSLYKQVVALGERAAIAGRVTPHVARHSFGDHVAKYAGLRVAQALMGHEDVNTTAGTYTSRPSLDELAAQVRGFSFRSEVPEIAGPFMDPEPVIGTDSGVSAA